VINKRKNIVLLGEQLVGWGGGIDFLRFCLNALTIVNNDNQMRLILLLPNLENREMWQVIRTILSPYKRMLKELLRLQRPVYYRHQQFNKQQLLDSFNNIDGKTEILFYDDRKRLADIVQGIGADIIIPSAFPLGAAFPLPWVGYLYDLQHKYYPDLFSTKERRYRDYLFDKMLREAKAVVVNAHSVKSDIEHFYPEAPCKVFNLPISATPVESWFDAPDPELTNKYKLPAHYFMISNQFWIHKAHGTAFKALSIFTEMSGRQDIHIICTGIPYDFRHPGYFKELLADIARMGLKDRIHFLGYIPKKDQIDIMRGSIGVLQPTLFEGGPGGGAVYDAVAMGVPAVLSDIPVNKEIAGEGTLFYFKTGSAEDMASEMVKLINSDMRRPERNELLNRGMQRTRRYAETLLEAAQYVSH
jgi:glycosyltransferase involved in cell wall biosynthesis